MLTDGPEPTLVTIRVGGHLDQHWSASLGGLTLTQEPDGTTTLSGRVTDQAQLYGVLARVRDLGATLISLTTLDAGSNAGGDSTLRHHGSPNSSLPKQ